MLCYYPEEWDLGCVEAVDVGKCDGFISPRAFKEDVSSLFIG